MSTNTKVDTNQRSLPRSGAILRGASLLLVAACLALGACNDDDALQLVDAAAKTDGGTDGGTLRGDASITGLDSSVGTNIDASILDATTPPSSTPQDAGSDAALNIVALSPNGHF